MPKKANPKKGHDWPAPVAAYVELEATHPVLVKAVRKLANKKKEQA